MYNNIWLPIVFSPECVKLVCKKGSKTASQRVRRHCNHYDVFVFAHSTDSYVGSPHILFNTSQSNPREGMPFALQCLTAPDPTAAIVWSRGGQELQLTNGLMLSEPHELIFETFASFDTGNYTCAVLDEGEIVAQDTIDLQFSG